MMKYIKRVLACLLIMVSFIAILGVALIVPNLLGFPNDNLLWSVIWIILSMVLLLPLMSPVYDLAIKLGD